MHKQQTNKQTTRKKAITIFLTCIEILVIEVYLNTIQKQNFRHMSLVILVSLCCCAMRLFVCFFFLEGILNGFLCGFSFFILRHKSLVSIVARHCKASVVNATTTLTALQTFTIVFQLPLIMVIKTGPCSLILYTRKTKYL